MKTLEFSDLERVEGKETPTFDLRLPSNPNLLRYTALRVQKLDEDPSYGYCYGILLMPGEVRVGIGLFTGIGTGGNNDLMDFLNAYVKAFHSAP